MAPVCVWDFTLWEKDTEGEGTVQSILEWCKLYCKKYTFQLEAGAQGGRPHYQGRVALGCKRRLAALMKTCCGTILETAHWSITSGANRSNMFYVMKPEGRLRGPWVDPEAKEEQQKTFIPKTVRELTELKPWQKTVIAISKVRNTRDINVIHDPDGGIGKSILCKYMKFNKLAEMIPPTMNDSRDIMRCVMNKGASSCYLIDIPRGMLPKNFNGLWPAIETIKDGQAYDDRYKFREIYFDEPNIFVFTNQMPDVNQLSADRWKFYKVLNDQLVWAEDESPVIFQGAEEVVCNTNYDGESQPNPDQEVQVAEHEIQGLPAFLEEHQSINVADLWPQDWEFSESSLTTTLSFSQPEEDEEQEEEPIEEANLSQFNDEEL